MELTVREAESKDDRRIGDLLVDAFVSTYATKMPEVVVDELRKKELREVALKRSHATVLVAEHKGEVIGTVAIFKPSSPRSEAWLPNSADLRHLAVDPAFHGRGVARPLLDEAERIAREEWRVDAICLHVRKGAHGVARLYQARGFLRETSGDFVKATTSLEGFVLRFMISSKE